MKNPSLYYISVTYKVVSYLYGSHITNFAGTKSGHVRDKKVGVGYGRAGEFEPYFETRSVTIN
jgi:hypothetical protein